MPRRRRRRQPKEQEIVVNPYRDFAERVGWTAIQAGAGAMIVALSSSVTWQEGGKMVGIVTALAACKVIVAQHFGARNDGAAIPGGVQE